MGSPYAAFPSELNAKEYYNCTVQTMMSQSERTNSRQYLQSKRTCAGFMYIPASLSSERVTSLLCLSLHLSQPRQRCHRTQFAPSSPSGHNTFLVFTYPCLLPVSLSDFTFALNIYFTTACFCICGWATSCFSKLKTRCGVP